MPSLSFTTFMCSAWKDQVPPEAVVVMHTNGTRLPWPWCQALEKEAGGHSKHCVCVEAQERRLVFRGSRGLHLPSQHLWPVSVTAHLSQAATYRTPPPCLLLYFRPSLPAWPHQPTLVSCDFSHALLCLLAFPMQLPPFGIFLIWLTPLSVGVSASPETLNLN